jgi:hypothetical protein
MLMKINAASGAEPPGKFAANKIGAGKENGHSNLDYRVPARALLPRRMGGNQQKGEPM